MVISGLKVKRKMTIEKAIELFADDSKEIFEEDIENCMVTTKIFKD